MPRGVPNVRPNPFGIGANEDVAEEVEEADPFQRQALEAAERITAAFMEQHPPPDRERRLQKRHYTYWKMCENPNCRISGHRARRGHIVIDIATGGPFGPQQVEEYAKAIHGTNLENALGKPGGWAANSIAMNEAGLLWDSYDPDFPWGSFTHLFMSPGGIHLMPIDQFCMLGFHRDPVLAKERREEIARMKFYTCDMCPEGKFEFIDPAHLEKHRSVDHKEHVSALAQARETAKVMTGFMGSNSNGGEDFLTCLMNLSPEERAAVRALLIEPED